ncbi:MAG: S16 family serine protease [Pseudomonadota bacterium]
MAALRGGIKTVLIPQENEKDLKELPTKIKKNLEIIPLSSADAVLEIALEAKPVPIEWPDDEEDDTVIDASPDGDDNAERMIKH